MKILDGVRVLAVTWWDSRRQTARISLSQSSLPPCIVTTLRLTVVHRKHGLFVRRPNSSFTSFLSSMLIFDWICFLSPVTVTFEILLLRLTANVVVQYVTQPTLPRKFSGSISVQGSGIQKYFGGFPQPFHVNPATVRQIRPQTLPFTSYPIHYSLIYKPSTPDKSKVRLSLTAPWGRREKRVIAAHILNLCTRWRRMVNFMPWKLYPLERTHWTRGWVDGKAGQDILEKRDSS